MKTAGKIVNNLINEIVIGKLSWSYLQNIWKHFMCLVFLKYYYTVIIYRTHIFMK